MSASAAFALASIAVWIGPAVSPAAAVPSLVPAGRFGFCHTGGGYNCVVDGDTLWVRGIRVRIADIDAPETHPSRCPLEAEIGGKATRRLAMLVNEGPFQMRRISRDTDRFGRTLRILERRGRSIGDILVQEGLARPYRGSRRAWC